MDAEYMRQWRADHPGYKAQWMRKHRKGMLRNRRVQILGVLVTPVWMPIPAVSKERAEAEFGSLYPKEELDR